MIVQLPIKSQIYNTGNSYTRSSYAGRATVGIGKSRGELTYSEKENIVFTMTLETENDIIYNSGELSQIAELFGEETAKEVDVTDEFDKNERIAFFILDEETAIRRLCFDVYELVGDEEWWTEGYKANIYETSE